MTGFDSFGCLAENFVEGTDYRIRLRDGVSGVLVMAPHGGRIEPGTDEIAETVAGNYHAFYAFCGLRENGNRRLHITSHRFDEPKALALAGRATVIVTIHGCRDKTPAVYIGGRHHGLRRQFKRQMAVAGFDVRRHPHLPGLHPANICNRGRCGRGVQLEISAGLRRRLFVGCARSGTLTATGALEDFIAAAGAAIADGMPPDRFRNSRTGGL
jgi:phage replication-related protein YjqB (UPF0714/DUF867 family)